MMMCPGCRTTVHSSQWNVLAIGRTILRLSIPMDTPTPPRPPPSKWANRVHFPHSPLWVDKRALGGYFFFPFHDFLPCKFPQINPAHPSLHPEGFLYRIFGLFSFRRLPPPRLVLPPPVGVLLPYRCYFVLIPM